MLNLLNFGWCSFWIMVFAPEQNVVNGVENIGECGEVDALDSSGQAVRLHEMKMVEVEVSGLNR